jgi:NarL family two-component system response regulator LiaR
MAAGGRETLQVWERHCPDVLVLTSSDDPAHSEAAIRSVHSGGRPLEGVAMRPGPAGGLTIREMQVLEHLAEGRTYAEIAHRLAISFRTVRAHGEAIQQKLHATNNTQAVAYAYQQGVLRSPGKP